MNIFKALLFLSAILTLAALVSACASTSTNSESEPQPYNARERAARALHELRGNMSDLQEAVGDMLSECKKEK